MKSRFNVNNKAKPEEENGSAGYTWSVSFEAWAMREGWCGDDHLIIFAESEVDPVSERYGMPALLPGYRILGLRGWDDFIVEDAAGRSYSIPTIPLDLQYLSPFNIPPNERLLKDERFEGKIKWYVKPVVFGGDPKAEDNITWVTHEQHAQVVRWWNNLYRSVRRPPKPM